MCVLTLVYVSDTYVYNYLQKRGKSIKSIALVLLYTGIFAQRRNGVNFNAWWSYFIRLRFRRRLFILIVVFTTVYRLLFAVYIMNF